jgi:hypothetical protein
MRSEKLPAARPIPFRIHIDRFVIRDRPLDVIMPGPKGRDLLRDPGSQGGNTLRHCGHLPTLPGGAAGGRQIPEHPVSNSVIHLNLGLSRGQMSFVLRCRRGHLIGCGPCRSNGALAVRRKLPWSAAATAYRRCCRSTANVRTRASSLDLSSLTIPATRG